MPGFVHGFVSLPFPSIARHQCLRKKHCNDFLTCEYDDACWSMILTNLKVDNFVWHKMPWMNSEEHCSDFLTCESNYDSTKNIAMTSLLQYLTYDKYDAELLMTDLSNVKVIDSSITPNTHQIIAATSLLDLCQNHDVDLSLTDLKVICKVKVICTVPTWVRFSVER